MIESVQNWVGRRKELLIGLAGAAMEGAAAAATPGLNIAVNMLREVAHETIEKSRFEKNQQQFEQVKEWLELLAGSYGGLVEQLERRLPDELPESVNELTLLVQRSLQEHDDLLAAFQQHAAQVQEAALSLGVVEEKLDEIYHVQLGVSASLEELKELHQQAFGDYARLREASPDALSAVLEADRHFLAGDRDRGVQVLLDLLQRRGVGKPTICHKLGLAMLGKGDLEQAEQYLRAAGDSDAGWRDVANSLALVSTCNGRKNSPGGWWALPRGFLIERKYQIEAEIGRGGMGSVYRAVCVDLVDPGQRVAIKAPAPNLMRDDQTQRRFVQEIQITRKLSHPHIVSTLGHVIFDDPHENREVYALVMELVEGHSLARLLAQREARGKRLSVDEVLTVMRPVLAALEYAHDQNPPVLHRDIKPHNVMVGGRGAVVKLMDFGVARVLEQRHRTLSGRGLGTPQYMPPEFNDPLAKADPRSDVYLAGNLLTELLTFHPARSVRRRDDCPLGWAALIKDAKQHDMEDRPESTAEFRARLEEAVEKKSVSVPKPPAVRAPSSSGPAPAPKKVRRTGDVMVGAKAGLLWSANGLSMKFHWCPPGTFRMGSPKSEEDRNNNEDQVSVTLTEGFWMAETAVTQKQWTAIRGTTLKEQNEKSEYKGIVGEGDRFPMCHVNYAESVEFCRKLTDQERRAGRLPTDWEYRLPTEAQWEYACRAGMTTPFGVGEGRSLSSREANFDGNYPYGGAAKGVYLQRTSEVGSYSANRWGLNDMHGNVWEWCRDWYQEKLPGGKDPDMSAASASFRVLRGGSWCYNARFCRSAFRFWHTPGIRSSSLGFRLVLVQSPAELKQAGVANGAGSGA